ncbi:MAG TPA: BACON domain-containing carbohydrate-binding protein, partial [Bacteroidales bacterium]|nr:BACON domain-containing carbohydrate-binding protein [Bacteroidales bacterium]
MRRVLLTSLLVIYILSGGALGQNSVTGPIVQLPVYFDVSPPLRDMVKQAPAVASSSWKDGIVKNKFRIRPNTAGQQPGGLTDPGLQTLDGMVPMDTTLVNFQGNTNTEGYTPPDTHGDVGPNHYFQVVNCHYSIYSKTGTLLVGPLANSSVFTGLPNNNNDGDAVVLYDEQADRWLFSQFSLPNYPNGPFYQMIAISQTADPTGSWYRYQYTFTDMPDYPKFGVWGDGYYMSMNRFTAGAGNWAGCGAVAYNRSLMLTGSAAATMVMFTKSSSDEAFGWLPSDCDGPFPTGNPPNYFLYNYDGTSNDHLGIYEFHVDWTNTANSTFTNFLSLPVTSFTANMTGITQPGTPVKLDVINDRMMYRLQYRNFGTYASMVCNHTVDASSSVAGIRWYELRKTTGAWSIYQQGTYSLSDNNSRWMGSIAQDSSGNMALGYSVSGSSVYPSIRYTGRRKNDALNQMTIAERGIYNGAGSQTSSGTRWGDYSAMSCDPSAKATYWYTTEYYTSTSATAWKTRIASFRWANTPVVATTSATNVTCTGATLNGTVNPSGLATTYHFEYGTTTSYGTNTTTTSAGNGSTAVAVNAAISGLTSGALYHFRLVAVNNDGVANGDDMTFVPCGPTVTTTAATAVTMTTASTGGNVVSDGGSTITARGVCWGTTANPTIAGSHTTDGSGTGVFISSLTGLLANTTYHIRAYATNATTTTYGSDMFFTTMCGIYTLPFNETFSATTIPSCWSQVDNQGNGQIWQFGTITGQTPLPALTGNYAYLNSDAYGSGNSQNTDLISPTLDLSTYTSVNLQFSHYFLSYTGSSGTLSYSINNGTTWTQIQQFTATSTTNPATFNQAVNAVAGQSQVKFKWNYTGTYGYSWAIDNVTITGSTSVPTLSVTPSNQNVTAAAGTTPFTVTSNSAWTATSNQSWCTVTPSGSGNGTITATYTQNTLTTQRVANVTVTVTGLTPIVVTVTQAGSVLLMTVTPPNQPVAATAGATTFTVTTNATTPWTSVSDQTWCTVTPTGTGNGTINANYTQNANLASRVANITVTVAGVSPVIVTVSQAGAAPTLSVAPSNQTVQPPAGTTSFTVTSNSAWIVSSDQTWCTVTPSGTGNGTITANYLENTSSSIRTANVTVTVAGLSPVVVTVTQLGVTPTLSVTPSNQDVTAPSGNTAFSVTTNSAWTASSDQGWCTVTSSGSGNGTLAATYQENTLTTQ